ncbi:4'-phosphopantetheinyl transferase [Seinonella peptonophila]|uniref:4'-phosphopantetheinyl transferase n=1 Tax=Seinonella peptonophila TaxID=112248 RepID=A0A1M5A7K1_9BACL|nr:4'-phosphopantetheinyl transferase superfamily protein [Seinonella peptonophila]SHF25986.1 4'-phosphopantetheinyl transferase [Seinonella peptonophila]
MNWYTPSSFVGLHGNDVHLWWIDVERFLHQRSSLFHLLSTMEQEQARRFVFTDDQNRYIVIHGICRLILSRYMNCFPQSIRYGTEQNGKPILIQAEEPTIHFNLSHSATKAVIALSFSQVGIDVEKMKENIPLDELVPHFMSMKEREEFYWLPRTVKTAAFYRCWTRKEAYVKAIGHGLSYPIKEIDVSIALKPILRDRVIPKNEQMWQIVNIPQVDEYMVSLVTKRQSISPSLLRYTDALFPFPPKQRANPLR